MGVIPDPLPGPGEVRIGIRGAVGVNPGDVKKRQNAFGYGMPYPRVIPHSDSAGYVDRVGEGVPSEWLQRRVWCYGAQTSSVRHRSGIHGRPDDAGRAVA